MSLFVSDLNRLAAPASRLKPTLSVPRISGAGSMQIGTVTTWRMPPACGQNELVSVPVEARWIARQRRVDAVEAFGRRDLREHAARRPVTSTDRRRAAADIPRRPAAPSSDRCVVYRGLQARQVRDEPRLAREVLEEQASVLLDERARLVEAAPQFLLGLRRHRDVDVVDREAIETTASSALAKKMRFVSERKQHALIGGRARS